MTQLTLHLVSNGLTNVMELTDVRLPTDPVPLQQHPNYAATLDLLGAGVVSHGIAHGGETIGHIVMTRRKFGPVCPHGLATRGPVWAAGTSPDDRIAALRMLTRDGVQVINAEARDARVLRAAGFRQIVTHATIAELDLTPRHDILSARLDQKWRNRLVQAEDTGLCVTTAPLCPTPAQWLFAQDAAQKKRRVYRTWPAALTCAFAMANPNATMLATASHKGAPVAAILILLHGTAATYHIGVTTDDGRALSAHNLLLWNAVLDLRGRGVTRLELGTLDTARAPGLARFKLATGAAARRLGGTWLRLPFGL